MFPLIPFPRGGREFRNFSLRVDCSFSPLSFLGVVQAVALTVGFDDLGAMGDAVKECSSKSLVHQDLGPLFEG